MEAAKLPTEGPVPTGAGQSEREQRDPRFQAAKHAGQGEQGREMLEHAAQGAELDEREELSALDWLLGVPKPVVHEIPVTVETHEGMRELRFVVRRVDPRKIDEIELRNMQQSTGRIDRITADAEIIAEACAEVVDQKGRRVRLSSEEFLTMHRLNERNEREPVHLASPAEALERRFKGQEGLLTLVAAELRRLAGYDPQRIGTAQRRLVEASLG